ncbi:MAG: hypothetical protein U0031_06080 [Thermomicrobiales bacterium]
MDGQRFDHLLLHVTRSRRSLAALAAATLLGMVTSSATAANKGGKGGKKKPECKLDRDCPSGLNCSPGGKCVCRANGRCDGCCKGTKICRPARFINVDECALNGEQCKPCGVGEQCDTEAGECVPNSACGENMDPCGNGCCNQRYCCNETGVCCTSGECCRDVHGAQYCCPFDGCCA